MRTTDLRVHQNFASRTYDLYLYQKVDGLLRTPEIVSTRLVEPNTAVDPILSLQKEEAQALMDSLWDAGIRPTEGTGSAGSLAATRAHLEDMRKIAFNRLEIGK